MPEPHRLSAGPCSAIRRPRHEVSHETSKLDSTATSALGIHRHTLRYRMAQIAGALDRDLDDPTVRSELWLALRLYQD